MSQGGRPGLPVPSSPYGLCGRKAALNLNTDSQSSGAVCGSRGGRPGLPVPNSPCCLCGRESSIELKRLEQSGTSVEPVWPSGNCKATSVRYPASALPSLQKLSFMDAVL